MTLNTSLLFSSFLSEERRSKLSENQLIDYYEKAGPDYETWSSNFNMHFGYYEKLMNPFNRELMLQKMNTMVLDKLT